MGVFVDTLDFQNDWSLVEGSTTDNSEQIHSNGWTTVYEIAFEKGEGIALGQGVRSNQTEAVGRIHTQFDSDGSSDISGWKLRLVVLNRQDNVRRVIAQFNSTQIERGANDRSSRQPFPVQERDDAGNPIFVAYPFKLGIQLKLNSGTDVVDDAEAGTTAEVDSLRFEDTGGQ